MDDNCCKPIDFEQLLDTELFKALGHPNRAKLFSILCQCACAQSVGELHACCDIDLSVVSRHLSHLKDAKLVDVVQEGQKRRYAPRRKAIAELLRQLADAIETSDLQGENDE